MERLNKFFDEHTKDCEAINNQRRVWLLASSAVFTGIILLIFGWDLVWNLHSRSIWWLIISLMLLISVNWWYWTMRVIRKLLNHQRIEFGLIRELLIDVKEVKKEVSQLGAQELDRLK